MLQNTTLAIERKRKGRERIDRAEIGRAERRARSQSAEHKTVKMGNKSTKRVRTGEERRKT